MTKKPAEAATAAIEKLVAQQDWVALWDVRDQPERRLRVPAARPAVGR